MTTCYELISYQPIQRFNDSTNHVVTALVAEIIRRRGFFGYEKR
jgi:hypothetical protein